MFSVIFRVSVTRLRVHTARCRRTDVAGLRSTNPRFPSGAGHRRSRPATAGLDRACHARRQCRWRASPAAAPTPPRFSSARIRLGAPGPYVLREEASSPQEHHLVIPASEAMPFSQNCQAMGNCAKRQWPRLGLDLGFHQRGIDGRRQQVCPVTRSIGPGEMVDEELHGDLGWQGAVAERAAIKQTQPRGPVGEGGRSGCCARYWLRCRPQ